MVRLTARSATLHRFYPAVPASIVQARGDLADFAAESGADAEQLDRIRLSSSEALTNVVQYAYEGQGGQIELLAAITDDGLCVHVADVGRGLCPGREGAGLGLGLAIMARLSDRLTIGTRSSGGLEVRMQFNFEAEPVRPECPYGRGSLASATSPASPRFSTTT